MRRGEAEALRWRSLPRSQPLPAGRPGGGSLRRHGLLLLPPQEAGPGRPAAAAASGGGGGSRPGRGGRRGEGAAVQLGPASQGTAPAVAPQPPTPRPRAAAAGVSAVLAGSAWPSSAARGLRGCSRGRAPAAAGHGWGGGGGLLPGGSSHTPPVPLLRLGRCSSVRLFLKKKKKVFSLRILPGSLKLCKRRGRHAGSGGRRLCQHRSPVRLRPRGGRAGRGQLTLRARAGGRGGGGGRQLGCGSRRGWRVYACRPSGFLIPRGVPWPCASPERTDAVALAGSRSAVCAGVG